MRLPDPCLYANCRAVAHADRCSNTEPSAVAHTDRHPPADTEPDCRAHTVRDRPPQSQSYAEPDGEPSRRIALAGLREWMGEAVARSR